MMNARIQIADERSEAGFSIIELMIALTITLLLMGVATTVLINSLGTRTRQNQKSDALGDAQRALNMMSREIANSGFGLYNQTLNIQDNGIVAANTTSTSIRVRANLVNNDTFTDDRDEDITYAFQPTTFSIVRYDNFPVGAGTTTVIANRIDNMQITYYDAAGNDVTNNAAQMPNVTRINIAVLVNLPASPTQPAAYVQLSSDVSLRNSCAVLENY